MPALLGLLDDLELDSVDVGMASLVAVTMTVAPGKLLLLYSLNPPSITYLLG